MAKEHPPGRPLAIGSKVDTGGNHRGTMIHYCLGSTMGMIYCGTAAILPRCNFQTKRGRQKSCHWSSSRRARVRATANLARISSWTQRVSHYPSRQPAAQHRELMMPPRQYHPFCLGDFPLCESKRSRSPTVRLLVTQLVST
ncbi:hypothetical protein BDV98DRAFT_290454 [Pterulicium gracile]|uniref:Uncharacterized protein n=1 Tax=Pterulicium gracile TaxID=1884261 RepID=A0A5C3QXI5_9AGAR|nr:hypothetical protein BDV98DRAFT_290454 [Pterula gracilis]